MKNIFNVERALDKLRLTARAIDGSARDKSTETTYRTKDLTELLMETNAWLTTTIQGCVIHYVIKRKSLGAGVWRVWLEKVEKS